MPTTLPPSVREHFGEQTAEAFSEWLDAYVQEHAVERDERPDREGGSAPGANREVLSGLDVLEEGLNHMDKRFDLLTEHVDDRLDDFEQRVDQRFEQIDRRFESMEERFDSRLVDLREEFNDRFESMDAKLDRMNDRILSMTR